MFLIFNIGDQEEAAGPGLSLTHSFLIAYRCDSVSDLRFRLVFFRRTTGLIPDDTTFEGFNIGVEMETGMSAS